MIAAGAIALGLTACTSSTSKSTPPTSRSAAEACAWPTIANQRINNIAYPDTHATYWVLSYRLAPGEHLELRGGFPTARYLSFVTYGPAGGVHDVLTDRDIVADPRSTNPFREADAPRSDPHRYRVQVRPDASSEANTITAAASALDRVVPAGTPAIVQPLGSGVAGQSGVVTGTLIYRVYLPASAKDPTGGAGLPAVASVKRNGARERYPTCAKARKSPTGEAIVRTNGPATDTPAPAQPTFIRPATNGTNLYPDPDNVYIATIVHYVPGQLVVVRGRAPTFPNTRAGVQITGTEQVRYWSLCTNEYRKPYPVTACVADESVPLDANGNYAFVVSTRGERPANATTADGITWINWGNTKVNALLLLRHMLASPDFVESAINLAPGALATSTMGAYAPRGTYCSVDAFTRGGLAAC